MREPKPKLDEDEFEYKERYNNFMAFRTRCKVHCMEVSHRNAEKFTYTTEELAIYMDYLMEKMDPSPVEEPDANDAEEPENNSELERKQ